MRRFSANFIYTVSGKILKNGIVETDDSGKILNIIDTNGALKESRGLEFYNGVIVPGFINAHCHLELSNLKGRINQGDGLPEFIESIIKYKQLKKKESSYYKAMDLQDQLMKNEGIVAVGDICNTSDTISAKKKSKIHYHNFIETIGLDTNVEQIVNKQLELLELFVENKLKATIVPHAPYSVSEELLKRIKEFHNRNSIISIHNQETESENDLFINKTGRLFEKLKKMNLNIDRIDSTGENSIVSIIDNFSTQGNLILVHNTYSSKKDITCISSKHPNVYWCLCPKSNLYIENTLPDISLFKNFNDYIIIGTDSLASNTKLSILDELKVLIKEFENIRFDDLIKWATINGAKALKIENRYGSIEKEKTPGLNLITNFDFEKMIPKEESMVKVLI